MLFEREGLAPISIAEGRRMIGGGIKRLIERGLALEGQTFTPAHVDALYRDYVAHCITRRTSPTARASSRASRPRLTCLPAAVLAVCTNRLAFLSVRLLEALKLARRFAAICGPDTFSIQKPDPEILCGTVGAAGGALAETMMVGDSGTDITTARAAGVPVIAVDFGYAEVPVATLAAGPRHQPFRGLAGCDRGSAAAGLRRNTDKPVSQVAPIAA